jgi:hypothetical protein
MTPDADALDALSQALPLGEIDIANLEREVELRAKLLGEIAVRDLRTSFVAPGGLRGDFDGIGGYRDGWRDWLETFDSYRSDLNETRVGVGSTVLITHQSGRPRGGMIDVENDSAVVVFWRDGLVERLEFHLDRGTALEAAGLEPGR